MPGAGVPGDPRVSLVLDVLGGTPLRDASARWSVDPALAQRWVRAFVEGGTARVTNRPAPEEASRRDRFLAAVAHELRSPLTVARGWAAVLEEEDLPAGAVRRVQDALDHLATRVEEVEYLVAASLGRIRLQPAPARLGDLVAALPDPPRTVGGAGPDIALPVDAAVYQRVLTDLWEAAALEPTPRHRAIEIHRDGTWWVLTVRRTGDPIEHRRLRALFEPFDRNDDDTGVTFGLYLARALTVALGGSLGVDQDDRGAALWLRTPAETPCAPPPAAVTGAATHRREERR